MTEGSRTIGEIGRKVDNLETKIDGIHETLNRIEIHFATEKEKVNHLTHEVKELREVPWRIAAGVSSVVTVSLTLLKTKLGFS